MSDAPQAHARRLEVRLLRRLPADACSTSRTSCWRSPDAVDIAEFREATSAASTGPYDLSLVEGSITTAHDAERIQEVRRAVPQRWSRSAPAPPPAAIQALRNFADVRRVHRGRLRLARVHLDARHLDADLRPRARSTSSCAAARSTSASCSRSSRAFLHGRKPGIPSTSVCTECKRRGTVCVTVAHGTPCLGPVTHAGCGALCPAYNRGCYGCFGPMETPNTGALVSAAAQPGGSTRARRRARLRDLQRRRGAVPGGGASG